MFSCFRLVNILHSNLHSSANSFFFNHFLGSMVDDTFGTLYQACLTKVNILVHSSKLIVINFLDCFPYIMNIM